MKLCEQWLSLADKIFPGRSYPKILIDYEKINSAVSVMNDMKMKGTATGEVNAFIAEINKMGEEPLDVS